MADKGAGSAVRRARRWIPIWFAGDVRWLVSGQVIRSFSLALLGVLAPLYLAALGYSTLQIGLLLSLGALGSAVIMVLVGLSADLVGRRRTLLILGWVALGGALLLMVSANFWSLAAALALTAVGGGGGAGTSGTSGPSYPPTQALLADRCRPEHRNLAFSALFFLSVITGAIGSEAAGLVTLAHQHGIALLTAYHWVFWLPVAANAGFVPTMLPVAESDRRSGVRPSRGALQLIGKLWMTNSLTGIAWGVMGPFMTYWFFLRYHVGTAQVGTLYAVANLAVACFSISAAPLARRMGVVRTVVLTRFIIVAFLLAMAVAPTFLLAGLFFLLRLAVGSVSVPLRQSFVMGVSEEGSRTAVAAFGNLPSTVTSSFAPSLSAYMVDAAGIESPIFVAAAAQLANAAVYYRVFRNMLPPEEAARAAQRTGRGVAAAGAQASPASPGAAQGQAPSAAPGPAQPQVPAPTPSPGPAPDTGPDRAPQAGPDSAPDSVPDSNPDSNPDSAPDSNPPSAPPPAPDHAPGQDGGSSVGPR